jgi:hypothetical protein
VKCFDAKERYRTLTGGGHRVHGTNTPSETDHDLILLLHQTSAEFFSSNRDPWNGEVEQIERDLLGAEGWVNLAQLFRALNSSIDYALLRNFETLPDSPRLSDHRDIDVLCASTRETAFIANAVPVCPESYRVLHKARVDGNDMLFDFRSVDDSYYDPLWARDMLKRRVVSPRGFFHLCDEDYFYSLLYHATVHKPSVDADYQRRLLEMPAKSRQINDESFRDPRELHQILDEFLVSNNYRFVEPDDLSVDFNSGFANVGKLSVERISANSKSLGSTFEQVFDQLDDCSIDAGELQKPAFRSRQVVKYFSANRACFLKDWNSPGLPQF